MQSLNQSNNNSSFPGSSLKLEAITNTNGDTMISIIPPITPHKFGRTPSHVCCVIDVSGSMQLEAKLVSEDGNKEGDGLSVLDLVKHAVKTVIRSLGDADSLSLVAFSTTAKVVLQETPMDFQGKTCAESALDSMDIESSTNIWDGLYKGLELIRASTSGKNSAIFLLTDGQPNEIPPEGHLPALKKYRDAHGLPNVINTFGFGYDLDSNLLHELAVEGNGAYAFIPDASFVGTIFVNALGNLLSTAASNVCLSLEIDKSSKPDYELIQHYHHQVTSWGVELQLGSVLFGQAKNIVIPFVTSLKEIPVTLQYYSPIDRKTSKDSVALEVQLVNSPLIEMHRLRLQFVNETMKAHELRIKKSLEVQNLIHNLINKIKQSSVANEKYVKDLLTDFQGEVAMALESEKNFDRWGVHFLPSIARAHLLQQCNNFKDPGVQHYGGELFRKTRDAVDEVFLKTPAPKPSCKPYSQQAQPINMGAYYNAGGGCIAGDCLVMMADGSLKLVKDIVKDDLIIGKNGEITKIVCVVKTTCQNQKAKLVKFESGLKITPWHPVRFGDKFFFPCTAEIPFSYEEFDDCPAVYNFVLENHHLMIVNGIECITLGHGFEEDVAKHAYFGTTAVLDDLKKIEGWDNGLVELVTTDFRRDSKTGMVTALSKETYNQSINEITFV